MRTWGFHNLGFDHDRDVAILQRVHRWFQKTCNADPPNDPDAWRMCFQALCCDVGGIVGYCQGAVTVVLAGPDDGQAAIADLKRRIDRACPGHEFDDLVGDVALRFGMKVDARKFREPRLSKWRQYLETLAEADDPRMQMVRMIERDMLDHAADVLPIDGTDVMHFLELPPGPEVRNALYRARELFRSGVRDREGLLTRLKDSSGQQPAVQSGSDV